jgi:hypothetical protein
MTRRSIAVSAAEKAAVTAVCEQLIEEFLKPRFLPAIRPTAFNYPVDIIGKWHGTKYRFIQRYRSGFLENQGEEFDAPLCPPRLDQPRPLRYPMASPHRRMVLPASQPIARQGNRNRENGWPSPSRLTASPQSCPCGPGRTVSVGSSSTCRVARSNPTVRSQPTLSLQQLRATAVRKDCPPFRRFSAGGSGPHINYLKSQILGSGRGI